MSNPAFLVLKQTPRGCSLLPLATISGTRGQRLSGAHLNIHRVKQVMDQLMVQVRFEVRAGRRIDLKAAFDLAILTHGREAFADCSYLAPVRDLPARLVIKEMI